MASIDTSRSDPVLEQLDSVAWAVWRVHRRFPLLDAYVANVGEVGKRFPDRHFSNDAVLQLLSDSFDMLVIDLASIREGLVRRHGLFDLLKTELGRFRLHRPEDFDSTANRLVAEQVNEAVTRLFPDGLPATPKGLEALSKRFRDDTHPVDRDRNRVRAHRYEQAFDPTHALPLGSVKQQLAIVGDYIRDLHLALKSSGFAHDSLQFHPDVMNTGQDLADLVILGSINAATIAYGLVPEQSSDAEPPWYWSKRDVCLRTLKRDA